MARRTQTVAVLRLVISYDAVPSDDELRELLDKAREVGGIDEADFELVMPHKRDLLKDL